MSNGNGNQDQNLNQATKPTPKTNATGAGNGMNSNVPLPHKLGVVTILSGELAGSEFYFDDGQTMTIGRGKDAQIRMPDSYTHVSRSHCTVAYDGLRGRFFIADTSTHGIKNDKGQKLEPQGYIKEGDVLLLGDDTCRVRFSVMENQKPAPATMPPQKKGPSKQEKEGKGKGYTAVIIFSTLLVAAAATFLIIFGINSRINKTPYYMRGKIGSLARREINLEKEEISAEEQAAIEDKINKQEEERQAEEEKRREQEEKEKEDFEDQVAQNTGGVQRTIDPAGESRYYYNALDADCKAMYDAMYDVAMHPKTTDYTARASVSHDVTDPDFYDQFIRAFESLVYDNPEFYWLHYGWMTFFNCEYATDDVHTLYFSLTNTYPDWEKEHNELRSAAAEFLADIDLTQSDDKVALAIHDKLIDMVTYDFDTYGNDDELLIHTAYGALVHNRKGQAHYAVCDGYSFTFSYLLHQVGIEAVLVTGVGGSRYDSGLHAWNCINLDGEWYEVDSTWDDYECPDYVYESMSKKEQKHYQEECTNEDFLFKYEHHLYNIPTDEFNEYEGLDHPISIVYSDGESSDLDMYSFHERLLSVDKYGPEAYVVQKAPIATGTKYRVW